MVKDSYTRIAEARETYENFARSSDPLLVIFGGAYGRPEFLLLKRFTALEQKIMTDEQVCTILHILGSHAGYMMAEVLPKEYQDAAFMADCMMHDMEYNGIEWTADMRNAYRDGLNDGIEEYEADQ